MGRKFYLGVETERLSMRHFVTFIRNHDDRYCFEKSSGKYIRILGLLFDQVGYPPNEQFVNWMEDLSERSFHSGEIEVFFPLSDRENVVIRKPGEFSFCFSRNEYVKLFWLWYSVVMEKPEKIIIIWDEEKTTVVQIDKEGKKLVFGERF